MVTQNGKQLISSLNPFKQWKNHVTGLIINVIRRELAFPMKSQKR